MVCLSKLLILGGFGAQSLVLAVDLAKKVKQVSADDANCAAHASERCALHCLCTFSNQKTVALRRMQLNSLIKLSKQTLQLILSQMPILDIGLWYFRRLCRFPVSPLILVNEFAE